MLQGDKNVTKIFAEITTHVAADNASRCRDQIEMILISVRQKLPFTHFVTFQIRDQAFVQRYKDLVDKIRALRNIPVGLRENAKS